MARYAIEFEPKAKKQLAALPKKIQAQIQTKLSVLEQDPRGMGCEKMVGSPYYRIRSGDYRVVYGIEDVTVIVLIVRIGHRREVYRH